MSKILIVEDDEKLSKELKNLDNYDGTSMSQEDI